MQPAAIGLVLWLYHPLFQHGTEQEFHSGFMSFELRYRTGINLPGQALREVAAADRHLSISHAMTLQASGCTA
ncbi:hypothetical protein SBA3_2540004 [Candidatus Sulfopaludibacter sp. SbA3]|nr:hypothetical protein SBA3_2540004 [Candidatus Sulfopaludibacter sp. SbA3]